MTRNHNNISTEDFHEKTFYGWKLQALRCKYFVDMDILVEHGFLKQLKKTGNNVPRVHKKRSQTMNLFYL